MNTYVLIALGVIVAALLWAWTVLVRESWPRRRRRCGACGHMMYLLEEKDPALTCAACGGDFRVVGLVSDGLWRLVRPHPMVRLLVMWTGVVFLGGVAAERLVLEPVGTRVVERRQVCAVGRRGGPLIEVTWVARAWAWPWEMRETRGAERYVEVVVRNSLRIAPDEEAVRVRVVPDTWHYVRIGGPAEHGTLSAEAMQRWMAEGWRGLHVSDPEKCAGEACALIRTGDRAVVPVMQSGMLHLGPMVELRPTWAWGLAYGWWLMGVVWVGGGVVVVVRGGRTSRERIGGSGPPVA